MSTEKKADFSDVRAKVDSTEQKAADFSDVSARVDSTEALIGERTYTIEKGDTLSKIAKDHLGRAGAWKQIFDANRDVLDDPDRIFPGRSQLPRADANDVLTHRLPSFPTSFVSRTHHEPIYRLRLIVPLAGSVARPLQEEEEAVVTPPWDQPAPAPARGNPHRHRSPTSITVGNTAPPTSRCSASTFGPVQDIVGEDRPATATMPHRSS